MLIVVIMEHFMIKIKKQLSEIKKAIGLIEQYISEVESGQLDNVGSNEKLNKEREKFILKIIRDVSNKNKRVNFVSYNIPIVVTTDNVKATPMTYILRRYSNSSIFKDNIESSKDVIHSTIDRLIDNGLIRLMEEHETINTYRGKCLLPIDNAPRGEAPRGEAPRGEAPRGNDWINTISIDYDTLCTDIVPLDDTHIPQDKGGLKGLTKKNKEGEGDKSQESGAVPPINIVSQSESKTLLKESFKDSAWDTSPPTYEIEEPPTEPTIKSTIIESVKVVNPVKFKVQVCSDKALKLVKDRAVPFSAPPSIEDALMEEPFPCRTLHVGMSFNVPDGLEGSDAVDYVDEVETNTNKEFAIVHHKEHNLIEVVRIA